MIEHARLAERPALSTRGCICCLVLPLQMAVVRAAPVTGSAAADGQQDRKRHRQSHNEMLIFALLAVVLSIAAGIGSIVVVHLLIFLQARGSISPWLSASARSSVRHRSGRALSSACSATTIIRSGP